MLLYLALVSCFTPILADITFSEATVNYDLYLPLYNKSMADIDETNVTWTSITNATATVPEEETKFPKFEHLTSLALGGGNLPVTKPGYFSNLPQLEILLLESFNITKVTSTLFDGIPLIKSLTLSYDQIEQIENGAFANLSLETLSFWGNKLTAIKPEWFLNCDGLRELDLRHNLIVEIQDDAFKYLKNLTTLYLHYNKIESVGENALNHLQSLTRINLKTNFLKVIPDNLFRGLDQLYELNLRFNNLTCLSDNVLNSLVNVTWLRLNGNNMTNDDCDTKLDHFSLAHPKIRMRWTPVWPGEKDIM